MPEVILQECKRVAIAWNANGWSRTPTFPAELAVVDTVTLPDSIMNMANDEVQVGKCGSATWQEAIFQPEKQFSFSGPIMYDDPVFWRMWNECLGDYDGSTTGGYKIHNGVFVTNMDTTNLEKTFKSFWWTEGNVGCYVPSFVVKKMKIEPVEGILRYTADCIGNMFVVSNASIKTDLEALTWASNDLGGGVYYPNATLRFNAFDGADFSAGDILDASKWSVTVERGLTTFSPVAGESFVSKPAETGFATVMIDGECNFLNSQNEGWTESYQTCDFFKARLQFTGGNITGSSPAHNHQFTFYFPKLKFETVSNAFTSPTPVTFTMKHMKALTNPTGMTQLLPYTKLDNGVTVYTNMPT